MPVLASQVTITLIALHPRIGSDELPNIPLCYASLLQVHVEALNIHIRLKHATAG